MAKIPLKHYLWLIDKLSKRPMTFAELRESFERSSLYDSNHPLQVRTLYNWRAKIDELFGIQIKYDNDAYQLKNYDSLDYKSPQRWLIQSLAVSDVVERKRHVQSRILLENIPSGDTYLTDIIGAMEDGRVVRLAYRRFSDEIDNTPIEVEPYCVKVCNRRWYVLCHNPKEKVSNSAPAEFRQYGSLKVYALDRIHHLELTDKTFVFPEEFSPEEFFAAHFGICIGYDVPLQRVLVRFDGEQRDYLRTLPLHSSQKELQVYDDYSVFEFFLHPTIDFVRAILSFGAEAEVLEPAELRQLMATEAEIMDDFYHSEKK